MLSGEKRPGDQLLQQEIADQLQISPTPVREALRLLEKEGIVTYSPHRGARVVTIQPKDAREVCLIRATLEELALEWTFPHLTQRDLDDLWDIQNEMEETLAKRELKRTRQLNKQFHLRMYQSANSPQLVDVIEHVWNRVPWDVLPALYEGADSVIKEHRALLEALEQRDLPRAKQAIFKHVSGWGEFLEKYLARTDLYEERVAQEMVVT